MLEILIRNCRGKRCLTVGCLTIVLMATSATLSSCASQAPKTALVSDPDAHPDSAIPWNRPASWEGREGLPDTGASSFGGGQQTSRGY
ncbi:MAG TPA: hypothetical protein VGI85_00880 [Chthoniobacterales bacterium]|jgi:hypothetical protein